jgi:hypothetical protein
MEIIFTLILLIGIGINSHRYDVKKQELPKQVVTSFIEDRSTDVTRETIQQEIKSNNESKININTKLSEVRRNTISKGKYISVRVTDGNG